MKIPKRRRLERKTDYKLRLALLKSGKTRLVLRKTNRYLIAQIVESETAQDKPLLTLSSSALLKKGWPKDLSGSLKSLPAAYLLGALIAKSTDEKGSLVLDLGMHRNVHKSRLYALVKGAQDSGLKIQCDPEVLPKIEEINKNEKTKAIFEKMKGET
ncbi:50S ribosomal protein L18 [Candidatus Pacearchaeota archaeon]|nr:50S ribosomal protein L18 [Candidatus Pacearchaeota archaeon]|tara:strand:- start:7161 stop:7631 length:471 start_codon:yes stop_codon:yes gene_type:complete